MGIPTFQCVFASILGACWERICRSSTCRCGVPELPNYFDCWSTWQFHRMLYCRSTKFWTQRYDGCVNSHDSHKPFHVHCIWKFSMADLCCLHTVILFCKLRNVFPPVSLLTLTECYVWRNIRIYTRSFPGPCSWHGFWYRIVAQ
jgi:hypothetical protein